MDSKTVEVEWTVAEDEGMRHIVKKGKASAAPALAHSVHVEVNGLKSQRPYWYRFKAGKELSPIGRTATTPKPGEAQPDLKFAFASCQHWEAGLWTAYEHMLGENPDLVVHLGDYIYEGPMRETGVRRHNSKEIVSLSDYRNRHSLYKTEPAIQRMHTHCPWILTWDDHEVDNNYAGDVPEDQQTREAFLERRSNAYQAYYEHMPLRLLRCRMGRRRKFIAACHMETWSSSACWIPGSTAPINPAVTARRPFATASSIPKARFWAMNRKRG